MIKSIISPLFDFLDFYVLFIEVTLFDFLDFHVLFIEVEEGWLISFDEIDPMLIWFFLRGWANMIYLRGWAISFDEINPMLWFLLY